ncbi:hypothetical protein INS49_005490 [Diaporthe citri]|uniref:uncharacterized protein n=1 Tax=Diaporthe citri TaxID=83186 RepID=UPI001C7E9EF4|nr:uncharacterized protein INS49_005490 [Diaporthe citri]KAG6353528.1 hypothetical protein INS49_005490 [Diaporthe citri]
METFTINGNIISGDEPKSADASNTNYIYVQGRGPIKPVQKQQLRAQQVQFHEYLGGNAYLCRYDRDDLKDIQVLDFVAQANVYPSRAKISSSLREIMEESQGTSTYTINVIFHETDKPVKEMINELIEELTREIPKLNAEAIFVDHNAMRLDIDKDTIDFLIAVDSVKTIEAHTTIKFTNTIATQDMYAPAMDQRGNPSYPYEGQDIVVAVADTGFDLGDMHDVHPAFQGRVLHLHGRRDGSTDDPHGHGTHVAGSILGDGHSQAMGGRIRGTAPKANLVMHSLLAYDQDGAPYLDDSFSLWDVIETPHRDHHARISSNSWGTGMKQVGSNYQQIEYDHKAETVDTFIWENQDHVMVFPAGNDGLIPNSRGKRAQIGSISAAKNCITVGATESSRRIDQDGIRFDPKGRMGLMDIVARFSSLGPTVEQRNKPDVVAPGVAILSAASRHGAFTTQQRTEYGAVVLYCARLWPKRVVLEIQVQRSSRHC